MVYILLGTGFEETEAVASYGILCRGGVKAAFVGVNSNKVKGSHGIEITCDCGIMDIDLNEAEIVVVPGGLRGVKSIKESQKTMELLKKASEMGTPLAAICAGPTVLAELGIMKNVKACCYPGMESFIPGADIDNSFMARTDGSIITGRSPGASIHFGLELLKFLKGEAHAKKIAGEMFYDY